MTAPRAYASEKSSHREDASGTSYQRLSVRRRSAAKNGGRQMRCGGGRDPWPTQATEREPCGDCGAGESQRQYESPGPVVRGHQPGAVVGPACDEHGRERNVRAVPRTGAVETGRLGSTTRGAQQLDRTMTAGTQAEGQPRHHGDDKQERQRGMNPSLADADHGYSGLCEPAWRVASAGAIWLCSRVMDC